MDLPILLFASFPNWLSSTSATSLLSGCAWLLGRWVLGSTPGASASVNMRVGVCISQGVGRLCGGGSPSITTHPTWEPAVPSDAEERHTLYQCQNNSGYLGLGESLELGFYTCEVRILKVNSPNTVLFYLFRFSDFCVAFLEGSGAPYGGRIWLISHGSGSLGSHGTRAGELHDDLSRSRTVKKEL